MKTVTVVTKIYLKTYLLHTQTMKLIVHLSDGSLLLQPSGLIEKLLYVPDVAYRRLGQDKVTERTTGATEVFLWLTHTHTPSELLGS